MSAMGVKIDQFDVPVCNSFQAKIQNDQLCYEVDLNRFVDAENLGSQLKLGFNIIMDYNEDRQIVFDDQVSQSKDINLAKRIVESEQEEHAFIYLNTIGKLIQFALHKHFLCLEPVKLIGEGEYNLNVLKESIATTSYLGLDQNIRECQNEESLYNCTTRKYIDSLLDQCGCLPLNIKIDKVKS